jgi:sugar/nucleoside kinase (ribokinase family)
LDVLTVGTCLVELTPGEGGLTVAQASSLTKLATGASALFACAAARLGARPALLSAVGDDELGDWVIDEFGRHDVETALIRRVPGQLTSLSLASADGLGGKTFRFYRFPGYSDPLAELDMAALPDERLREARLFDFTESCIRTPGRLRDGVLDLARRSRSLGLEICYAPNWRPALWREGVEDASRVQREAVGLADLVLLNAEEAGLISGETDVRKAALALGKLGPHTIAVTSGGDHPLLVWSRGEFHEVPPIPVEVRYDVGAGDTFHAGFVAGRLQNLDVHAAARFASAAAALKITRPPYLEDLPRRDEVEAFLRKHSTGSGADRINDTARSAEAKEAIEDAGPGPGAGRAG